MTICYKVSSESQTIALGKAIGENLSGSEIIELVSDLGGGKTTLVKGIAEGIESEDLVSSPTFTISNIYMSKKLRIYHYDFYRLGNLGLMDDDLREALTQDDAVCVIEWAKTAKEILPVDRLIEIEIKLVKDLENQRLINITLPDKMKYLLATIKAAQC